MPHAIMYNINPTIYPLSRYETTLLTHSCSIFLTSVLKFSTSCQQSNGRLSFSVKHLTTSLLELSTPSGSDLICLRPSSCLRRSSTCLLTPSRDFSFSEGAGAEEAMASWAEARVLDCWDWSFWSSEVTRAWIWASIRRWREASVYRVPVSSILSKRGSPELQRTSWLLCSESTRSCDTELGPELFGGPSVLSSGIEAGEITHDLKTCAGDGFDSFAPMLTGSMALRRG